MKMKKLSIIKNFTLPGLGVFFMASSMQLHANETYELTFSTYLPPAYEYVWKPIQAFIDHVETASEGAVKINVFHSGQLFDAYEELPALSRGDIDITNMTGTYPSGTVEALTLFTMPFIFDDVNHMQRALQQGLLDLGMRQELEERHDTYVLGVAPWDPYEFYTKGFSIDSVEDFSGKTWATTGATDARALQLLGGAPTTMASSDLYLSFERGVIDGTPRPLLTGMGRSLYEVTDHITLTNFAIDTSILAINADTWDALSDNIQVIFEEAAAIRDQRQFDMVNEFISSAVGEYESLGMIVTTLDPETISQLAERTQTAIDEWVEAVPNGEKYIELIEATR
ncbi:TRAP transporter substrate-binding protein DctP [Halomonas sp. PGE1]|uniref:TRAP transporter substrate-binding protein DctP n=1 Tax=Halomonas sp. PGE1 TaxID=2730360 RepID=UPI0014744581|nr:TRAP transporter substrate-binding protein DctP [Halomonas sp. PGE1]QJR00127.1 TRAP transporter substrate-binding protein DctP [Halomonas sp. PGE1]